MEKSEILIDDKLRLKIVQEELAEFKKLIKGHEKFLIEVGKL